MTNNDASLKPCPFCGGKAGMDSVGVHCADIDCRAHVIKGFTEEEWNRRADVAIVRDADHIVDANKMVLGKENSESLTNAGANVKENGNIEHVQDTREAFEKWILSIGGNREYLATCEIYGKYKQMSVQNSWDAWQAALSSRAEPTVRNIYEAMRNNAAPAYTKQDKEG